MKTENFHCEEWSIDASKSSQILSAVMMISPLLSNKGIINFPTGTVSRPFLEITRKMIKSFSGDERFKCEIFDDRIDIFAVTREKIISNMRSNLMQLLQAISLLFPKLLEDLVN